MLEALLTCGPFEGIRTSAEPYYLPPGLGAEATNVDISYRVGAFSTALGRTLLGTISVPAGYTIKGLQSLVSFSGNSPLVVKRVYVFSATSSTGTYQGWFDPSTGISTQLPYASAFTQAVQFGSALWTNGGDKIYFLQTGLLASDPWQINVPYPYSFQLTGTYEVVSGSAPLDTYTYAVTLRKAESWTITGTGPVTLSPDIDSVQESSPVYSTSVAVASGQQPGFTVPSSLGLSQLVTGLTFGGDTYYGCLYRSRTLNPTFTFVDYLVNITQANDHNGDLSFIDTYSDAQIVDNAYLTPHHDVPPMTGQTYPGATNNNSLPTSLGQANQQVSFIYTNPTYIAKHKSRMWAFTLYPTEPLGAASAPASISFQPQLWYSDYGTPWSFNDAQGVLLIGPEDTPGNLTYESGTANGAPWEPGEVEDTPMPIVSIGSILVQFKTQTTWITYGDTPTEYIPRRAFDIGCMAPGSVTPAEGGCFWLAPQGVYFFDGNAPSYIGEDVRGIIEALPWATRQAAIGSYRDRTFYLAFATQTLCYYLPTQKWYTLPYGATAAISAPYNQNQLIFADGNALYTMASNAATDLGQPMTATWQSAVSDSQKPGVLKQYRFMQLVAPNQPGIAALTLTLDATFGTPRTFSWSWDLSMGNGAFVVSLPPNLQGYEAQLTLEVTPDSTATAPIVVRSCGVYGSVEHGLESTVLFDKSGALNGIRQG